MKTEAGRVVDAKGEAVEWFVDDGSCPECGADKKRQSQTLGGLLVCQECGHERRKGKP